MKFCNNNTMKSFVIFVVVLAGMAVAAGVAVNAFREKPLGFFYKSKEARLEEAVGRIQESNGGIQPPQRRLQTTVAMFETLDYMQMKKIVESGGAVILDVRPDLFYQLGHIHGALNLPRDDFEKGYAAMKEALDADNNRLIVVYCADSNCEDATLAADALKKLGYAHVSIYTGGWAEWRHNSITND